MSGVNFGRSGARVREVLELLCRLIPACRLLNVWNQCNDLYTTNVVNRSYTTIIILFYISDSVVQRSTDSTCELKRKRKRKRLGGETRLLQTRTQVSCRTYFLSTGVEVTTSNTEVKDFQTIRSDFALGFDRDSGDLQLDAH